jgi:hypothetical protein
MASTRWLLAGGAHVGGGVAAPAHERQQTVAAASMRLIVLGLPGLAGGSHPPGIDGARSTQLTDRMLDSLRQKTVGPLAAKKTPSADLALHLRLVSDYRPRGHPL